MQPNNLIDIYLRKMFKEFKSTYKIKDKNCNYNNFSYYSDEFFEWIRLKNKASENYVQLLDYMHKLDSESPMTIVETGKGIYDTTASEMVSATNHTPILISPYASTIVANYLFESYTGNLCLNKYYGPVIEYKELDDYVCNPNCNPHIRNNINALMTQLPFSKEEILPYLSLVNSNKTLFIGTYGNLTDENRKENLETIESLYRRIQNISSNQVAFASETSNDSYLSAIEVKPKEKVLVKRYYR